MSRLDDALGVRDLALPFLETYGHWEGTNVGRVRAAVWGSFSLVHWGALESAFGQLGSGYRSEAYLAHVASMGEGLDIWHRGRKVFSIFWGNAPDLGVVTYRRRGSWEAALEKAISQACGGGGVG